MRPQRMEELTERRSGDEEKAGISTTSSSLTPNANRVHHWCHSETTRRQPRLMQERGVVLVYL